MRQGPQSILVFLGDTRSGFHGFFKVRIIGADFEPFRGFPDKDFIAFLEMKPVDQFFWNAQRQTVADSRNFQGVHDFDLMIYMC